MVDKILERVASQDTLETSPEGRNGRERAVRPGVAAAALRAEAGKASKLKHSDLDDDSFADLPMALQLPGASAFIGTPVHAKSVSTVLGQPSLSPDIVAAKARVADLR